MSDKLQIIRQQPYQQLKRALDNVVAKQPELTSGCALIQRPLDLLQEFGTSAYDALDNDIKAIERMQLTIQMAASDTYEIRNALSDSLEGHQGPAKQPPCEQGLLDLGALAIVALAAGRVGHRLERSDDYIDVIEATAVASLPAQAFTRALNAGLDYTGLAALLSGLSHKEPRYTRLRALAPTLLNPCDAALFRCIQNLLDYVQKQVPYVPIGKAKKPREWDGAISEVIASIHPDGQDKLLIKLKDEWFKNSKKSISVQKFDRVIFVSPSQESSTSVEQDIPYDREDLLSFSIPIPPEARSGWLGLQTEDMRKQLIQHREKLTDSLEKQNTDQICLRDKGIPIEHLRDTTHLLPAPHFHTAAVWGVRILDIELTQKENAGVEIIVRLSKTTELPRVHLQLTDRQQKTFDQDLILDNENLNAHGDIPIEYISPYNGVVHLFVRDDEHPDDVKNFEYESNSRDTSSSGQGSGNDVNTPETLNMVLLRPTFIHQATDPEDKKTTDKDTRIDRLTKQKVKQAFDATKTVLQNQFDLQEVTLPWIADDEQTINSDVPNMDGPININLVEHLDSLATLTVGAENHVFIALIPKTNNTSYFKVIRSEAARALVVCTSDRLTEATQIAAKTKASKHERGSTKRLRIMGKLRNGKVTTTEPVRVETRAVGTGGDYLTGVVAVGFRADGSKVLSQRLRTVNASRNGDFMSLLDVSHDITSVQLLYKPDIFGVELKAVPEAIKARLTNVSDQAVSYTVDGLVERPITPSHTGPLPSFHQPQGNPYIEITALDTKNISWRYGHSRGILPHVEIELRFGDIWRRVYSAPEGSTSAAIDFTRLAPGTEIDGLRVVASDGWNIMVKEKDKTALQNSGLILVGEKAIIRSAGELEYWLDTDDDVAGIVTWSFPGNAGEPDQDINKLPIDSVLKITDAKHIGKNIIAKLGGIKTKPIKIVKRFKSKKNRRLFPRNTNIIV